MKNLSHLIIIIIAFLSSIESNAQSALFIKASTGETYELKGSEKATIKTLNIKLPDTGFSKIYFVINESIKIGFSCEAKDKMCYVIHASDIDSGKIKLVFKDKSLVAIGDKLFPFTQDILNGEKDTIKIFTTQKDKPFPISIPFVKKATEKNIASSTPEKGAFKSTTFCYDESRILRELSESLHTLIENLKNPTLKKEVDSIFKKGGTAKDVLDSLEVVIKTKDNAGNGSLLFGKIQETRKLISDLALNHSFAPLDSILFLCASKSKVADKCCGTAIPNQFENMYLKPCFDKKGHAVSISNVLFYNILEEDPFKKVFLLKVRDASSKIQNCSGCTDKKPFEFGRIIHQMSPRVDDILVVATVAHKDSLISVDTSYVNYFLDSAVAAQGAFSGVSQKITADSEKDKNKPDSVKPVSIARKAVSLNMEMAAFNSQFSNGQFLQVFYNSQLLCIQQNIVKEFQLSSVPISGNALALAIEEKLKKEITSKEYYNFLCALLNSIAAEYQAAITRQGNLKIFTRVLQVPNADEFSVGIKSGKQGTSVYSHKFNVKGGIKIDFSTGVFLVGLNNRDFVLRSTNMRFIDDDPTRPNGGKVDTVGNFIDINAKKLNYGAGLMAHVYYRSGYYANAGIATGVSITNSNFTWMLGGSLMFRMGSGRLSLVGGLAFGKDKELDINQQQYLYLKNQPKVEEINSSTSPLDPSTLPRFFPETNIQTYDKLKASWFAGITYNFASIKL